MSGEVETTYLAISEALQDLFVRQRTGRLVCSTEAGRTTFFTLGGQLYLSGTNPWRARLEEALTQPTPPGDAPFFDPHRYLASLSEEIVKGLGRDLSALGLRRIRFRPGLGEVPNDLVGPVPTAELVMDLAVRNRSHKQLLRRLGGPEAALRAAPDPRLRLRVPYLSAEEAALLTRLQTRAVVEVLLAEEPNGRAMARRLVRLQAVGLIERAAENGIIAAAVSREVVESLAERIREDLATNPLELTVEEHRTRIAQLLSAYGSQGHYELLGVEAGASADDVHTAFMRLARIAHPDHAERLGLDRSGRKLEWLSSRLVEAYLVLSDPVRAAEYRKSGRSEGGLAEVRKNVLARESEREALAEETYRAALDYVEAEEYHFAIELLEQAALTHERPEYYSLLGHCRMQNPRWMRAAIDSFRRAVRLSPEDTELRQQLAEATELYRAHREAEGSEPATSPADAQHVRAKRMMEKLWSDWR